MPEAETGGFASGLSVKRTLMRLKMKQSKQSAVLQVKGKAYFDSYKGLVSGRIVAIVGKPGQANSLYTVAMQVTANHAPYKKGEYIISTPFYIVPRAAVSRRKHRINIGPFQVFPPEGQKDIDKLLDLWYHPNLAQRYARWLLGGGTLTFEQWLEQDNHTLYLFEKAFA